MISFVSKLDDTFGSLAFFPWTKESLIQFWRQPISTTDKSDADADYSRFVSTCEDVDTQFHDAIAIGGRSTLCLCFTKSAKRPVVIKVPRVIELWYNNLKLMGSFSVSRLSGCNRCRLRTGCMGNPTGLIRARHTIFPSQPPIFV